MLAPYNGQVKSIFLPNDQEALSQKGRFQKLANLFIGQANMLANYFPTAERSPRSRDSIRSQHEALTITTSKSSRKDNNPFC